jgi:hypothetical protein
MMLSRQCETVIERRQFKRWCRQQNPTNREFHAADFLRNYSAQAIMGADAR